MSRKTRRKTAGPAPAPRPATPAPLPDGGGDYIRTPDGGVAPDGGAPDGEPRDTTEDTES